MSKTKKMGYIFFPKDWRSSMNVCQLNLQERGFYRELIDECFIQNSSKITINCKTFARLFQLNSRSLTRLLAKLHESLLIVCPNFDETSGELEIIIPSVTDRLAFIEVQKERGKMKASTTQNWAAKIKQKKIKEKKEKEKEKEKEKQPTPTFSFLQALIDKGADKQKALDWIKVRKAKKGVDTITAFKAFEREVNKAGIDINRALEICIENDWRGFRYDWAVERKFLKKKLPPPTDFQI